MGIRSDHQPNEGGAPARLPHDDRRKPTMTEKCYCYDIPTKTTCGQPATRYIRIGTVIEHLCQSCYDRDIQYPGAHPATEAEYEAYQGSDDDA